MNNQKTEAMWLGQDKNRTLKLHNLKWVKQVKILGIHFRSDISPQNIDDNWTKKIDRMKRTIKQWTRRNLSIYGKKLIAKTLLVSHLIYTMQSIGIPDHILLTINRVLYTFIWKKKSTRKLLKKKTEGPCAGN